MMPKHPPAEAAHPSDVVVIGGGPAGSIAAGLLARKGHSVTIVTRPESRHALAESLPPSSLRLFDRLGLSSMINEAGFLRSRGNTVWWGTENPRLELFPGEETGLQIHRQDFDRLLLSMAERIGVRVVRNAVVRKVAGGANPLVSYDANGETTTQEARWVLDCSGRAGVLAGEVRVHEPGRETVALAAAWTRPGGWDLEDESHTFVESYVDGWAWSVPVNHELRHVTVMVDKSLTSLDRGGELSKMYQAEIAKTSHMLDLTSRAELAEPHWACGASPYGATQYTWNNCLLVGDAASFIDPLSSYGVKKAMASAWVAAAAVHTAMHQSDMAGPALQFFADRESEVYARFRDLTTQQYEAVSQGTPHPFWTSRATGDPADLLSPSEPDITALKDDPEVQRAFETLRNAPSIDFEVAADVERVQRPGINIDQIVMEDRLACPWMPEGIRFLRGVDLLTLADIAARHDQVPDLYDDYNRRAVPVALPNMLGAISVMIAKGLLRSKDN